MLAPFTYKVFFMHQMELKLSHREFKAMPIREFYEYLWHCFTKNEKDKEKIPKT